jgi:hypothetical protein
MHEDDIDKRKWLRTRPSPGAGWDAAVEFGVDVTLLERNLELTLEQRFQQLEEMLALAAALNPEEPARADPGTPYHRPPDADLSRGR